MGNVLVNQNQVPDHIYIIMQSVLCDHMGIFPLWVKGKAGVMICHRGGGWWGNAGVRSLPWH